MAKLTSGVRVVGLFPSAQDAFQALSMLERHGLTGGSVNRPEDLSPTVDRIRQRAAKAVTRLGPIAGPEAAAANFATWFGVIGFAAGLAISAAGGAEASASIAIGFAAASACWLGGLLRVSRRLSLRALVAVHTTEVSCVGVSTRGLPQGLLARFLLSWQGARFIRQLRGPTPSKPGTPPAQTELVDQAHPA